jgi:hypothetical protein
MNYQILLISIFMWASIETNPIEVYNSTKTSFIKQEIDALKKLLFSIVHCERNYCSICSHVEVKTINLNETS